MLWLDPLNPGSIILFSGSMLVSNIMEKVINEFSWFCYEMSGKAQEIINETVSHLSRLFYSILSRRGGRVCLQY